MMNIVAGIDVGKKRLDVLGVAGSGTEFQQHRRGYRSAAGMGAEQRRNRSGVRVYRRV